MWEHVGNTGENCSKIFGEETAELAPPPHGVGSTPPLFESEPFMLMTTLSDAIGSLCAAAVTKRKSSALVIV